MSADWMTIVMAFGFASLWLILFWHNAQILPASVGFDASQHLITSSTYRNIIVSPARTGNGDVPSSALLHHIAVILSLFNLTTTDPSGILLLRALTMLFGIAQFVLVFATLRLIFSKSPDLQLVGGSMGAFLPMQLYMSHNPTNETLAAVLVSASLYFALRMAKSGPATWKSYCVLGLLLGVALLTKSDRCFGSPVYRPGSRLSTGLRAGLRHTVDRNTWQHAPHCDPDLRLALHSNSQYGSPLVGGSDPVNGVFWWQETAITPSLISPALVKAWSAHYLVSPHHSLMGSTPLCGGMDYAAEYRTYPCAPPWTII